MVSSWHPQIHELCLKHKISSAYIPYPPIDIYIYTIINIYSIYIYIYLIKYIMFLDSQTVWCQEASCSTDTLTRNRWNIEPNKEDVEPKFLSDTEISGFGPSPAAREDMKLESRRDSGMGGSNWMMNCWFYNNGYIYI